MLYKTVFVKACFKAVGEYQNVKVATGEKKAGLFGGEKDVTRNEKKWVQTGFSDSEIDGVLLQDEMNQSIDKLEKEGYEIISITPVTSGSYKWQYKESQGMNPGGGFGYGYGFSYTEGIIIVARKGA